MLTNSLTKTSSTRTTPARTTQPATTAKSYRLDLLRAKNTLMEAELAEHPAQRYIAAHRAALQVAAVVLALRAQPNSRPGLRNAWQLVAQVAPEYGEWAGYFHALQHRREIAQGHPGVITSREADDLVRDAGEFLAVLERRLDRCSVIARPQTAGRAQRAERTWPT